MKTLKILLLLALLGAIALSVPMLVSFLADRPLRDPLQFLLFRDDTEYAERYSESRFGEARSGMSQREVLDLLGPPLRIIEDCNGRTRRKIELKDQERTVSFPDLPPHADCPLTSTIFYYTRPGSSSDHWYVRAVRFAPDGTASEVTKSFYAD